MLSESSALARMACSVHSMSAMFVSVRWISFRKMHTEGSSITCERICVSPGNVHFVCVCDNDRRARAHGNVS